jgi:hypothetical protein
MNEKLNWQGTLLAIQPRIRLMRLFDKRSINSKPATFWPDVPLTDSRGSRSSSTLGHRTGYVGSLVVDGRTSRPTEYKGSHVEPPDWWDEFWQRHLANTGQSREDRIAMLKKLLGDRWQVASLEQAEKAVEEAGNTAGGSTP